MFVDCSYRYIEARLVKTSFLDFFLLSNESNAKKFEIDREEEKNFETERETRIERFAPRMQGREILFNRDATLIPREHYYRANVYISTRFKHVYIYIYNS